MQTISNIIRFLFKRHRRISPDVLMVESMTEQEKLNWFKEQLSAEYKPKYWFLSNYTGPNDFIVYYIRDGIEVEVSCFKNKVNNYYIELTFDKKVKTAHFAFKTGYAFLIEENDESLEDFAQVFWDFMSRMNGVDRPEDIKPCRAYANYSETLPKQTNYCFPRLINLSF